MKLKTAIIRLLTKHADYQWLRKLYNNFFHISSWIRYGDPYFPRIVTIEISSHCNRACTYCPNVVAPQKPRLINEDSFRKIVSRLREIKYNGVVDFIFSPNQPSTQSSQNTSKSLNEKSRGVCRESAPMETSSRPKKPRR